MDLDLSRSYGFMGQEHQRRWQPWQRVLAWDLDRIAIMGTMGTTRYTVAWKQQKMAGRSMDGFKVQGAVDREVRQSIAMRAVAMTSMEATGMISMVATGMRMADIGKKAGNTTGIPTTRSTRALQRTYTCGPPST